MLTLTADSAIFWGGTEAVSTVSLTHISLETVQKADSICLVYFTMAKWSELSDLVNCIENKPRPRNNPPLIITVSTHF